MKKNLIFELIPFLLHLKYKANGFSYMKIYKMRGRILLLEVIDPAYICWTHSLFLLVLLCLIGKLNSASLCSHCVPMSACLHLNLWGTGGGWNIWEREIWHFLLFIQGFPGVLAALPASTFCQVNQRPGIHHHGLLSLFLQHAAANS